MGEPSSFLPRMLARSNRNPSMRKLIVQYRRHSKIICWTMGWLQFKVLPQPLKL